MSVGHGAYGVRSNLRRFAELVEDSEGDRRQFIELGPGLTLNHEQFSADQSGAYKIPFLRIYDGVIRDLVGVDVSEGIGDSIDTLTRVETLAEVRATEGTWFLDIAAAQTALETWDMAGLTWDGTTKWDQYPQADLYVHLRNGADPTSAAVTCVALLRFRFASKGEVHPVLGPNKLSSDYSAWVPTARGRWDSGEVWDGTLVWDTDYGWDSQASTSQVSLSTTGAFTGSASRKIVVGTVVAGAPYRVSAKYTSSAAFSSGLSLRVLLRPGATNIMYSDGRTYDASGFITITPTAGNPRGFFIDFLCPAYSGDFTLELQLVGSASDVGSVTFEEIAFQRIYRFEFFEPRLPAGATIDAEVAATTILFGEKTVGMGGLKIINGDGILEPIFGELDLTRKPVQQWVGGAFGDGQAIYAEDWWPASYGYVTDPACDDEAFDLRVEDGRTFLKLQLPLRTYSANEFVDLAKEADGKPRPIGFGRKGPAKPWRIGKTAFGYGVYEFFDTQQAPNGIAGMPSIGLTEEAPFLADVEFGSFVDEEAANAPLRIDSGGNQRFGGQYRLKRDLLSLTYDQYNPQYTEDLSLARVTINSCPKVFQFDFTGSQFSWQSNTGTWTITEAFESARTPADFRRFAEAAFFGVDPDVVFVFDESTKKFTITKPGGTLTLKITSAPQPHLSIWPKMGFAPGADKSGSLSYTSDTAIYDEKSDLDATILRAIIDGYRDDALGTYTGTPSAVIEKGPDIALCLIERWAGIPRARIDVPSFVAGRSTTAGARALTVYISELQTVQQILATIEATCLANIVIDGAGVVSWRPYVSGTPAGIRDFYDRDYLSFRVIKPEGNIYKGVRIFYGNDHRFEGHDSVELRDESVPTKTRRAQMLDIMTYLRTSTDATQLASSYFPVVTGGPAIVEFSACTKLVDLAIGDKVRLTRTRAGLVDGGRLDAVVFRIQRLATEFVSGVTQCTAIRDIAFM